VQTVVMPAWRGLWTPLSGARLEVNVARAWRQPTLEELYRPSTTALGGNPNLKPEDGWETGAAASFHAGPISAIASVYAARMSNMIAYVNVNAFDVRPENLGGVWRAGGEVAAQLNLAAWAELGGGADVNFSRVDVTGAPLPSVSAFDTRVSAKVGPPRVRLTVDGTLRSGARGNLYGELPIRPALCANAGLEAVVFPGFRMLTMITNLADDRTQTDLWGVPQPGREAWISLVADATEVTP
jgi:outer membrane receptor protein involved in Fe transport